MSTIWRLDFGMHYGEPMSKILDQEKVNVLKLKYNNVNYMKYYYGQLEVGTKHGNCEEIANDLYTIYKCPIKISIEDEYGIDKIGSISYHPSLRKYEGANYSDSDSNNSDDSDMYANVDKVYKNWKLTRPVIDHETKQVKKIIRILEEYCFSDEDSDDYSDNGSDTTYNTDNKYARVDEAYDDWVHTRPDTDFESEEGIRIIKILTKKK